MSSPANDEVIQDVKQLGLVAAIISLGYVFWIVGAMEMVERLAFYGVRSVAGLYAKDPVSAGGLGLKPAQYGTILMWWALFQSVIPIFVGGLADRYGYGNPAREVQAKYLDGDRTGAAAALPDELVQAVSIATDPAGLPDRVAAYREAGVDLLIAIPGGDELGTIRALAGAH